MRFANGYGFYELNVFPGCNQIVVSNHAFVYPQHRGRGVGRATHHDRLHHAQQLGYDYIMCTVVSTNEPQLAILKKYGWKQLDTFFNKETGNTVLIYGKQLT